MAELESNEIGFIAAETRMRVLEMLVLPDGTRRAYIALDEEEITPHGWVTTVAKDGSDSIKLDASSIKPSDIIQSADEEDTAGEANKASAPSPAPAPAAAQSSSAAAGNVAASASSACAPAPAAPRINSVASSELRAIAAKYMERVLAEEDKLGDKHKLLKQRVGEALWSTQAKVKELVASWARDGHGAINKMDFRKHVRKVVDEPEVKKIDALFNDWDDDGGGTLDTAELTAAMKQLQEEAKRLKERNQKIFEQRDRFQARVDSANAAADMMAEAEVAQEQLEQLLSSRSVGCAIGAVLVKKSLKVGDVVNAWDSTRGEVDKKQFQTNVGKSMGIKATSEELEALFDSFDEDAGGTLDLEELKLALNSLKEASITMDKKIAVLQAKKEAASKKANVMQKDVKETLRRDEADAKSSEQQEALEAERMLQAEADAKAAKEAAAEAAAKKKELAKAEFDRKVASRRGGSAGS